MKKIHILSIMAIAFVLVYCMCACGSTSDNESVSTTTETETQIDDNTMTTDEDVPEDLEVDLNNELLDQYANDDEDGLLNPDYSANTDIVFSEGNSEEWKYSHNKREFPVKPCYSKISTTAITKHFWGKEDEIQVYLLFTGAKNCDIESTKGVIDTVESGDPNVMIFKKTLYAAKEKKAETVTSEFKIVPQKACGLRIDVVYDSTVPRKFDDSSTIYFTNK